MNESFYSIITNTGAQIINDALSIASLVCSCFSVHSSKKGIKIVSGFIIFFSILTIVIGLALPFILLISSSST